MTASTAMLRVSPSTRDIVMRIASVDYGGLSVEETILRLVDEHWERQAIESMDRFRVEDPQGYAEYLAELDEFDRTPAPATDGWEG